MVLKVAGSSPVIHPIAAPFLKHRSKPWSAGRPVFQALEVRGRCFSRRWNFFWPFSQALDGRGARKDTASLSPLVPATGHVTEPNSAEMTAGGSAKGTAWIYHGAGGGSRTHTRLPSADFESAASAIPPLRQKERWVSLLQWCAGVKKRLLAGISVSRSRARIGPGRCRTRVVRAASSMSVPISRRFRCARSCARPRRCRSRDPCCPRRSRRS